MLINLHVKNLAIIDEIEVNFSEQFNVLSGETGAGKSIIIGSILLALGSKASQDVIRTGKDYALVELLFSVDCDSQRQLLEQLGISVEDDQVLISRKIMPKRSVCRVNGETVTVSVLRQISEVFIDIHGQNEQQSLKSREKQLEILDRFSKAELGNLVQEYRQHLDAYRALENELQDGECSEEERLREISFMEYEINEIEQAKLKEGEEEQLEELYQKLTHANAIAEGLGQIHQVTSSGSGAASDQISNAVRILLKLAEYDEQLQEYYEQLSEIDSLLTDFNREIAGYMDDFELDPQTLAMTEQRLDQIRALQAKYGSNINEVHCYAQKLREKLEQYKEYDAYRSELYQKRDKEHQALEELGRQISDIRKESAVLLQEDITNALIELNFLQVKFEIAITKTDQYYKNGMDTIEFQLSTNPGEPLRALSDAASGGELSRIMLAIKTVLAQHDDVDTMIFDEIDVGISGRTAQKVAEKMAMIGKSHQVICISHLAQIAAMADTHYLIEKTQESMRTITRIRSLDRRESIAELARILGGASITEAVMESADEMKELADEKKQEIRS